MSQFAAVAAGFGVGLSLIVAIGAQNAFVLRQGLKREHVGPVVAVCAISDALLIGVGISGIATAVAHLPWLLGTIRLVGGVFLLGYGLLAARRALRREAEGGLQAAEDLPARTGNAVSAVGHAASAAGSGTPQTAAHWNQQAEADSPLSGPGAVPLASGPGSPPAGDSASQPLLPRVRPRPIALRTALLTTLALTWLNPHVYLDTVFLLGSVANSHGNPARWFFGAGAATASLVWFTALGYGSRLLRPVLRTPTAWRVLDIGIAVIMLALGLSLLRGA